MAPRRRKSGGKRGKNEGSAYPLRRNGKIIGWQAAVTINGKLERRNAPTEQAAEKARLDLIRLRDAGIDVGSGRQTLRQWATEWLKIMEHNLRDLTIQNYRHQLTAYILPHIGDKRLDAISSDDIQAMFSMLMHAIQRASDGKHDGVRTVRQCAQRLTQLFTLAVERDYILKSPMIGVVLPTPNPQPIHPVSEAQITALLMLALDDIDEAETGSEHHYFALCYGVLWHIFALLGLRHSEGLGLKWEDVNWEQQTIAIVRAVTNRNGAGPTPGKTKTKAGVRTLPVPPVLISLLRRLQTAQNALRLRQGPRWRDNGYIVCGRHGGAFWATYTETKWRQIRDRVGIAETVTIHTLRHGVATMLDETEGCTEAVKAAIIGHGPKTITQHYTHARIAAMRRVLERMTDRVLRRRVG